MGINTIIYLFGLLLLFLYCNGTTIDIHSSVHHASPAKGKPCREIDFDAVYMIENGTIWERRCHTCACVDGETLCWGPQCTLKYDPSFEYTCTLWSEDGCCCEHVGCIVEGQRIDMDAWYPSPDYPCVTCQCSEGQTTLCQFSEDCQTGDVNLDESSIY